MLGYQNHQKTDTYNYEVTLDDVRRTIKIMFEDNVFSAAAYSFSGVYSRDEWRALAAIENKISEIELELEGVS